MTNPNLFPYSRQRRDRAPGGVWNDKRVLAELAAAKRRLTDFGMPSAERDVVRFTALARERGLLP